VTTGRVFVLGGTGWVGGALGRALGARGVEHALLSRSRVRYDDSATLTELLRRERPRLLINAAGFTGRPNVDACEDARGETLRGNLLLPVTIAHACAAADVPWAHVSSGCIYSGARLSTGGVVKDVRTPEVRRALCAGAQLLGFREDDPPNFCFDDPPTSFYSGSKALAESALGGEPRLWIFRLRMPFDEHDGPQNLLSKLLRYPKLVDTVNSLSHFGHFVEACLDLALGGAPFGTYNLTNPGFISTRELARLLEQHVAPGKRFEFWESDAAFYAEAARAPRSSCVLDASKALAAGARLPPVDAALEEALSRWDGPR
jgi:dTDP-4-dehydrorhamnose reductase